MPLAIKSTLQANALDVLSSLLNLVGEEISYFATFQRAGVSKAGTTLQLPPTDKIVRLFKTLVTDIQDVYGDAKRELVRNLDRFDQSLQDAGLLLIRRVDDNVFTILSNQDGIQKDIIFC